MNFYNLSIRSWIRWEKLNFHHNLWLLLNKIFHMLMIINLCKTSLTLFLDATQIEICKEEILIAKLLDHLASGKLEFCRYRNISNISPITLYCSETWRTILITLRHVTLSILIQNRVNIYYSCIKKVLQITMENLILWKLIPSPM